MTGNREREKGLTCIFFLALCFFQSVCEAVIPLMATLLASLHGPALLLGTELLYLSISVIFFISKLANRMPTLALEVALNDRMIVTQAAFSTETVWFWEGK